MIINLFLNLLEVGKNGAIVDVSAEMHGPGRYNKIRGKCRLYLPGLRQSARAGSLSLVLPAGQGRLCVACLPRN